MEKSAVPSPKDTEQSFLVKAPELSLPKGGGAIRGIGEKFAANPVTGTGSMSVPIATSPGRSGFGPQLSISYDSGAGNGPFGFGWSLSLPSVTRKTDKGLPQYLDALESDVFVLSGAEELVPVLAKNAQGHLEREVLPPTEVASITYRIQRYRPRIEGLFARIERWTNVDDPEDVHWRSISKDNLLTLYGHDENSRIADPLDASRISSWLICESRDDKGNGIRYIYKPEDGTWQPRPGEPDPFNQVHQRNRGPVSDSRRTVQRYLQRVLYGNVRPLLNDEGHRPRYLSELTHPPSDTGADWLFEVRFDYGELYEGDPTGLPEKPWLYRPDAFSSYRSGFEVRTCRRCERVLMLHHIPDRPASLGRAAQAGYRGVVRSTEFTYDDEVEPNLATRPVYSFLKQVVQTGWKQEGGSTERRSLPPVGFEYTQPVVRNVVEDVDSESLENLPIGLDGSAYRWTDLHGEGIPGILTEQAGAWFYKRNLSPIGKQPVEFAPLERVSSKPNLALAGGSAQFMDLAGDGQPDLVVMDGPVPGLYEHDEAESWQPFRPFTSHLNRDMRDPNLKFIDLNGDGHADVLITEDDAFAWHASLAEAGFGPARRVAWAMDEEKGPRLVFADGTQSIYLADLSGDGLTDLARIRNGEVCYWPNLGYGRFGAKVTMDHAPYFDNPEQFDHQRIRLADIDGSGTTDIIYLDSDGVRLYFNQSGNGWGAPQTLRVFPRVDEVVSIVPTDLLGNGTACLVWSSPLPGDARRQMRYVDLMGGQKPHLLFKTVNNLGAETRVHYASSTTFYLRDKRDGKPWITRLPFPVHVVEKVETYDHVSRNRFVTRYAYHHGHFDGEEREFRGFGMVEQQDTEQLATLSKSDVFPPGDNVAAESHVPPVLTKTWFHTGVYFGRDHVSDFFAGLLNVTDQSEYFREPDLRYPDQVRGLLLPDTELPPGLTLAEEREACRSLKGAMLRQEVYALDKSAKEPFPYTVTEQSFTIRALQPQAGNLHAVFFTHAREAIKYHYERNPVDPRIQHTLTLEVDDYGNVLKEAAIGYGRRNADASLPTDEDREKQKLVHITCTESSLTNALDHDADRYRTPLPAETRTYELRKPEQEKSGVGLPKLYRFSEILRHVQHAADGLHDIAYEDTGFDQAKQAAAIDANEGDRYFRRLIEHVRTLYREDDLTSLLPLRELQPLALPGEAYKLALTPGLLAHVYRRDGADMLPDPASVLGGQGADRGGYVDLDGDGHWWLPAGRVFLSPNTNDTAAQELAHARQHFFLPHRTRDPFAAESFCTYDAPHDLLVVETRDALGNRITVGEREHVLPDGTVLPAAPGNDYRVLQPWRVMDPNRNRAQVAFDTLGMVVGTAVMGKPEETLGDSLVDFVDDLTAAVTLDHLTNPLTDPHAILGRATTRLVYDLFAYQRTEGTANPQPAVVYTLTRETHDADVAHDEKTKVQHSLSYSDGFGREIQKKIQAEPQKINGASGPPRWVGSGWTIFNNKGKPVRQYEPFFSPLLSAGHRFEFGALFGVSTVLFYDPAERVVATLHPNHSYEKVVFDPWSQTTHDANDTLLNEDGTSANPEDDPDVADFFRHLPDAEYLPTWHGLRTLPQHAAAFAQRYPDARLRAHEAAAGTKAAAHAGTPAIAYFDALGRPFLTVARNRVVCKDHALDGKPDEDFCTRVELDIEGNQRAVLDERKLPANGLPGGALEQRVVMRYAYEMLGNRIYQLSMEAGARWMLNDVSGKPIRTWDSRGHNFVTKYDALRRPIEQYVHGTTNFSDSRTRARPILVEKIEYGEDEIHEETLNLRTRVYRHADSAGIMTNAALNRNSNRTEAYDFKGNLLRSTRQMASDYTDIPDWLLVVRLDDEIFTSSTRYDALNRPIQSIAPHSSLLRGHPMRLRFNIIQPVFNEANLLEAVDVWLDRADEPTARLNPVDDGPSLVGISNIDYDAKGQHQRIDYKNGASTRYAYDEESLRLIHLYTRRGAAFIQDCDNPTIAAPERPPAGKSCGLQNLHYSYDPVGNITHIQDDAQQTIYFKNQRVEPSNDYTYDALYRLIEATGREHLGQGGAPIPHSYNDVGRVGVLSAAAAGIFGPNDGNAMGRYTERYVYDAVGNFMQMKHDRTDTSTPGWSRSYAYNEASVTEPAKRSNRLTGTTVGGNTEAYSTMGDGYDPHGSMLRMPQLQSMQWDHKDQLRTSQRQKVNDEDLDGKKHHGDRTYYVYDAAGQRVRKVTELGGGNVSEERIYLGSFEIFRRHGGAIGANTPTLERETLHVMDDKQRIAVVETRTTTPEQLIRYQFGNHLGSPSLELDHQAQIISYEEYAPYGSSTYQAVRSQTDTPKRYRHTGKEGDEESGLHYHGARYRAAWLGRWVSCDPAGFVDGPNIYAYVSKNPIIGADSTGYADDGPRLYANHPDPPAVADAKEQQAIANLEKPGWLDGNPLLAIGIATAYGLKQDLLAVIDLVAPEPADPRRDLLKAASKSDEDFVKKDHVDALLAIVKNALPFAPQLMAAKPLSTVLAEATPLMGLLESKVIGATASLRAPVVSGQPFAPALGEITPAGSTRVFYGQESGPSVVARFTGNNVTFESETTADFVDIVAQQAGRADPGMHVVVGTGTHGTQSGAWALTDPTTAKLAFFNEDVGTFAQGRLSEIGPRSVLDVAKPSLAADFLRAEQAASVAPPGTIKTIAAWCYSAFKLPP